MTSQRTKKDIRPQVFFKGYDYGNEEPTPHSPGGGLWMNQDKYKSVGEFIKKRRKQRKALMKKEMRAIFQHNDMSLVSTAQSLDGMDVFPDNLKELQDHYKEKDVLHLIAPKDDNVVLMGDLNNEDEEGVIEINLDGGHPSFNYKLDKIPGSREPDGFDIPDEIEVEEPTEVEVEDDPWGWTHDNLHEKVEKLMHSYPSHDGKSLTGVERALAHGDAVRKMILDASRTDRNNKLDVDQLERALEEIHDGQKRLNERKEKLERIKYNGKKKKKAEDESNEIVKEAKIAGINGIVVSVPLLISSIARSCINGMVSAGKDIERVYGDLSKEYSLSKRERLELLQCLADMGYDVRRDLGVPLDDEIDTKSEDNVNWAANYPG